MFKLSLIICFSICAHLSLAQKETIKSYNDAAKNEVENQIDKEISDWVTFDHKDYNIQHPTDWSVDTSGQMGVKFFLFSPLSYQGDSFRENVNLTQQDLSGYNINLDQFTALSVKEVATIFQDGKIVSSDKLQKHNKDFQRVIYTGKQGVHSLKFMQYYWVENNTAYILTLTTEEDQFSQYQTMGEKMLDSFTFDSE